MYASPGLIAANREKSCAACWGEDCNRGQVVMGQNCPKLAAPRIPFQHHWETARALRYSRAFLKQTMQNPDRAPTHPLGLRLWLIYATTMTAGGWVLSACGWLNPAGLGGLVLLALGIWIFITRSDAVRPAARIAGEWRRWRRFRVRRMLPMLFVLIAVVAVGGGALNEPYNYDSLWYRIPRMLHWLREGRWHWIHTDEFRMNVSAVHSEWITIPLLASGLGPRSLFLVNAVSFLLLPGVFYAMLVALGTRRRVAWYWMWLLPSGWVYAFQAGSLANDILAAPYVMAAILYGVRGSAGQRGALVWSILAAGLFTGAKLFLLPLLLPWLVCAAPGWREALRHPRSLLFGSMVAGLASLLPLALMCQLNSGTWLGTTKTDGYVPAHPLFAIPANLGIVTVSNLLPPFFPPSNSWNSWIAQAASKPPLKTWTAGFEAFGSLPPAADETGAGLGLGLTALALAGLLFPRIRASRVPLRRDWFAASVIVATLVFMAKVGPSQINRYLAPYFPLILAVALRQPGQGALVRCSWFHRGAVLSALVSLVCVMACRQHPFPVVIGLLDWAAKRVPTNQLVAKVHEAYSWRLESVRRFRNICSALPAGSAIGVLLHSPGEHELWRSNLRVWHIKADDSIARWRALGIHYVLVDTSLLPGRDSDQWAKDRELTQVRSLPSSPRLAGSEAPIHLFEWILSQPRVSPKK